MSKVKEYSAMTKDKLMTYTFVALLILTVIAVVLWSPVTSNSGWNLGLTVAITSLIAVGVAVGADALLYKVAADSPLNTMSAAVFGLIVALSYSLGAPAMTTFAESIMPLEAPDAFIWVGFISLVGLVLFKKIQGLAGRKFLNPAASAKLLVLLPFLSTVLLPADHSLNIPTLAASLNYDGFSSFGAWMLFCFGNPAPIAAGVPPALTQSAVFETLFLNKFHGWVGGASSLAVLIVGLALFVMCRRYIKWRITLSYFVTTAVLAYLLSIAYGGDPALRLMFHLFIGSSIFLAFFMATDPATTPLTYMGQLMFGAGLSILTMLIQTYMGFWGGSILALIVMNLTSPMLDKVGKLKPIEEKKAAKLPKAKQFATVKTTECIRCGACMRVCCHKLSPILIKEAFDKTNVNKIAKLQANLCEGCGHCSFVCPARIDLKGSILRAKAMLRKR
jgi:electron transport complex protein RnfD